LAVEVMRAVGVAVIAGVGDERGAQDAVTLKTSTTTILHTPASIFFNAFPSTALRVVKVEYT
jgi:hypothetical protein